MSNRTISQHIPAHIHLRIPYHTYHTIPYRTHAWARCEQGVRYSATTPAHNNTMHNIIPYEHNTIPTGSKTRIPFSHLQYMYNILPFFMYNILFPFSCTIYFSFSHVQYSYLFSCTILFLFFHVRYTSLFSCIVFFFFHV